MDPVRTADQFASEVSWEGRPVAEIRRAWDAPLELYRTLASTNDRALAWSRDGAPSWSTVIADEQTAGRGRRGRSWESRAGLGLWMSVVVPAAPIRAATLPLQVGLVVAKAVELHRPAHHRQGSENAVWVKWPNDLLVNGRKVAGVLCEVAAPDRIVVGIGVNVSHQESDFGPDLAGRAGSFRTEWSATVSRYDLALTIFRGLGRIGPSAELDLLSLTDLNRRDALAGRSVRVAGAVGVAAGIAGDGALLVKTGNEGTLRVTTGPIEIDGGH